METEMDCAMIVRLSHYIVSPLAMGTQENYECVKAGQTMLRRYVGKWGLPEPFVASMMDDESLSMSCQEEGISLLSYTKFERMAILAAVRALRKTDINPAESDVIFILATTKGNIELQDEEYGSRFPVERLGLMEAAKQVTEWFHHPFVPLVVCNACISGLSAQQEAVRALCSGRYRYAVVIGVDVLSPFVVSGFQSLKAVSDQMCRPFDEDRNGLNLGEAAACIIYGRDTDGGTRDASSWYVTDGAIRNDAFHLSGVSRTAEGAYRALKTVCEHQDTSRLAFINVHGTATLFNDEMEATAIHRMGFDSLPVVGLKGYYGHTMGASGVLETLIAMEALDEHIVLATQGYEYIGVSHEVNVSNINRTACGTDFLKIMSGFGGCNMALWFSNEKPVSDTEGFISERCLEFHSYCLFD
ncbi:MAG: beta-ketoacyl synthase [Paraprevotella sp.]|nr:beta-ketoacyl synthase [Paraprevotella sp.]